jgi:hypothetical protein
MISYLRNNVIIVYMFLYVNIKFITIIDVLDHLLQLSLHIIIYKTIKILLCRLENLLLCGVTYMLTIRERMFAFICIQTFCIISKGIYGILLSSVLYTDPNYFFFGFLSMIHDSVKGYMVFCTHVFVKGFFSIA